MSEPLRAYEPDEEQPASASPARAHPHLDTPQLTGHHSTLEVSALDDLGVEELRARARAVAEAEAAVAAVMRREVEKAERLAVVEGRQRPKPKPLRLVLLASLVAFNAYLWTGNPPWLRWHEPPAPSIDYYQNSYKIAVYLQRQRIEEYRFAKKQLPSVARQAGPPVRGVQYTPLASDRYMLQAGNGFRMIVYTSTESIQVFMGRTLEKMGLYAGRGVR